MTIRDSRTAPKVHSIWQPIPEKIFRQHLVHLAEKCNGVPKGPQSYTLTRKITNRHPKRALPLNIEVDLAQDFALLASWQESVESISAACIESPDEGQGGSLTIRIAANDGVHGSVRHGFTQILETLQHRARNELSRVECRKQIFRQIIILHRNRIHARLFSRKRKGPNKPGLKDTKPLWADLRTLTEQPTWIKAVGRATLPYRQQYGNLSILYQQHESTDTLEAELESLEELVRQSFYASQPIKTAQGKLQLPQQEELLKVIHSNKIIKRVDKIGAYHRIAHDLTVAASNMKPLFINISAEYEPPYTKVPSTIKWPRTKQDNPCRVHAEVQMVVAYDLARSQDKSFNQPRVIGSSKATCFLCHLFIQKHGTYFVPQEHGHLRLLWTIPDLSIFSNEIIKKYRQVIKEMDSETLRLQRLNFPVRQDPMNSWQSLSRILSHTPAITSFASVKQLDSKDPVQILTEATVTEIDLSEAVQDEDKRTEVVEATAEHVENIANSSEGYVANDTGERERSQELEAEPEVSSTEIIQTVQPDESRTNLPLVSHSDTLLPTTTGSQVKRSLDAPTDLGKQLASPSPLHASASSLPRTFTSAINIDTRMRSIPRQTSASQSANASSLTTKRPILTSEQWMMYVPQRRGHNVNKRRQRTNTIRADAIKRSSPHTLAQGQGCHLTPAPDLTLYVELESLQQADPVRQRSVRCDVVGASSVLLANHNNDMKASVDVEIDDMVVGEDLTVDFGPTAVTEKVRFINLKRKATNGTDCLLKLEWIE